MLKPEFLPVETTKQYKGYDMKENLRMSLPNFHPSMNVVLHKTNLTQSRLHLGATMFGLASNIPSFAIRLCRSIGQLGASFCVCAGC